jgi:type II restriction enzyme
MMGQRMLPYGKLERHREAMGRFGQGMKPVSAIARVLA